MAVVAVNTITDRKSKIFAVVIAFFLLFSVILSSAFLAKEAGHNCSDKNCPICSCIAQCQRTLQEIGSGLVLVAIQVSFVAAFLISRHFNFSHLSAKTPVSRKVRMNN